MFHVCRDVEWMVQMLKDLKLLVLDEAHLHCDTFGVNTRSLIQCISQACRALQKHLLPIMLVSATMESAVAFGQKLSGKYPVGMFG